MKRTISLILSAVMVMSMCFGMNFSALAKNVTRIEYSAEEPLTLYEGSDSYKDRYLDDNDEWQEYDKYGISGYSLLEEGNKLTVFYDDDTSEVYTCREVYVEDEDYYILRFANENDEFIEPFDMEIDENQGKDNIWTPGNTYTFYIEYMGQRAEATARVLANPVKGFAIEYEGDGITVFENCCGEFDTDGEGNEWFNYYYTSNYLRTLNPVIKVTDNEDNVTEYTFNNDSWTAVDEQGNEFDDRHLYVDMDMENNAVHYEYYGYEVEVPINLVAKHDVDEGEITVENRKKAYFYGDEWHSFTFTPAESGKYNFYDSLVSNTADDEYECVCTVNGEVLPNNFEWDDLVYVMEAGKTYTLKFRRADWSCEDGINYEFLNVSGPSIAVTDFEFIPDGGEINAYDGGSSNSFDIYSRGNAIEFKLSNGDEKRFVYGERGYYDEESDQELWEYCEDMDLDDGIYYEANCRNWSQGNEAYLTFFFNGASSRVDVNVLPSPIKAVSINPGQPLKVYDGTAESRGDEDREYGHYYVDQDMLLTEGTTITVTDNNDEQATYTYQRVDGGDYVYDAFVSEGGNEILPEQLSIDDGQSYENQWAVGNTYPVKAYYLGKYATLTVSVEQCPVKSISVTLDNPITLFKNCAGEERYDWSTGSDFFSYYSNENYLRAQHARIKVVYSDNSEKTFVYTESRWYPVDENDNEIEGRYLEFYFDQCGTKEKNETPVAVLSYYQKETTVPVQVVDKHDVNDGALELLKEKNLLFIEDELHTFTFTPANSGGYIFSNSLSWGVLEDGNYSFEIEDENGAAPQRINDDLLAFNLEGGKTYTITTKNLSDDCIRGESVGVYPYVYVEDFEFTPVNPLVATEGERFDDRQFFFVDGTKIKITLSNGDVSTFTAVDNGNRFANEEGESVESFLRDENIDTDFYMVPSHDFWVYGEDSYVTLHIGDKEKNYPVEVQQSHVGSIQFTPAKPVEIVDGMIWYYEWEGEYVSEIVDMIAKPGDVLTVNYTDGRGTVNYVMSDNEEAFVNENDPNEKIRTEFFYDETKKYNVGDSIDFMLSFQTATTNFTGTVIENPVTNAVYTPAQPFEFDENHDGRIWQRERYDEEKDDWVNDDFFCYNEKDIFAAGSTFTVTYREGNRTVTYTSDGENFVSEDGEVLPNAYIGALWGRDQYEAPYLPDKDNIIYVHFMNYDTAVNVKINHVAGEAKTENAVPATCTASGSYNLVVYCTECNKELSREHKTTGKKNHTVVTDAAVPATFTAAGKTEGTHCSACGEVFVKQNGIAKLGSPTLKKPKRGKKSFTIQWNKAAGVDGYQVQYSLKKNFKKPTTKWVNPGKTKLTVKKLKSKKTYYVRIRAYKKINGKNVYSAWSVKNVKTK